MSLTTVATIALIAHRLRASRATERNRTGPIRRMTRLAAARRAPGSATRP